MNTKKPSFTLAETLITIAIIGIVAALTIPSVVSNYRKYELEARFKKATSDINKVYTLMRKDFGQQLTPSVFGQNGICYYFKKYFKVKASGSFHYSSVATPPYTNLFGRQGLVTSDMDDGSFLTADGYTFFFENYRVGGNYRTIYVTVDTNSHKKAPNRMGYDLFRFTLTGKGFVPVGASGAGYSESDGKGWCNPNYKKTDRDYNMGVSCTYRAIIDKDYFKNLKY